ncbi:MAG: hypothetical protein IKL62_03145 [Clostridia bacterium]|nr:hypothetical protein [Clostridia bacterium]
MQNNNIDRKKLFAAIGELSKNGGLKRAVENGNYSDILASLPKEQADELSSLMSDSAARERLLSSPQAKELLRRLGKDGK